MHINFIDNSRVMLQKKTKWRMLWRKWVNLRTFWGSSNSSSSSNTLISTAAKPCFNIIPFNIGKYTLVHMGTLLPAVCIWGMYIITSYKLLYDVIIHPCHVKIYMQLTRSLQVLAWRWVERHFPTIFTHQGLTLSYVFKETFRKNWCRVYT